MNFLILTSLIVFISTFSCKLPDKKTPAFFWVNDNAFYYDENFDGCPLKMKLFAEENKYDNINIISFGDSLELHNCISGDHQKLQSGFFHFLCNSYQDNIHIFFRRVYGFYGNFHERHPRIFTNIALEAAAEFKNMNYTADAVIYGSFLWDLLRAANSYCKSRQIHFISANMTVNDAILMVICDRLVHNTTEVAKNFTPLDYIEAWNRIEIPWCNISFLKSWQSNYLSAIAAIVKNFPTAIIYLRTQPVSSASFQGNKFCYAGMNNFIRYISSLNKREFQYAVRKSADTKFQWKLGTSHDKRKQLFKLIDLNALFDLPNNHSFFAADKIHLNRFESPEDVELYGGKNHSVSPYTFYRAYYDVLLRQEFEKRKD